MRGGGKGIITLSGLIVTIIVTIGYDEVMQVSSRFSIGVHILSLLGAYPDAENTSEYMAGSIGANPVVVRNVTGMLRRAGLVATQQGVAGTRLVKPLEEITLRDVYGAVRAVEDGNLFGFHPNPHPNCLVGGNIEATLEREFTAAQAAMENRLAQTTLQEVVRKLREAASGRPPGDSTHC